MKIFKMSNVTFPEGSDVFKIQSYIQGEWAIRLDTGELLYGGMNKEQLEEYSKSKKQLLNDENKSNS